MFTTCLCDKLFRFSNFVIFLFVSLVVALLLVFVNLFYVYTPALQEVNQFSGGAISISDGLLLFQII